MIRVGVIGARRRRQGIGFHLARFCADAGGTVVGLVGTRPETAGDAARALKDVGIEVRPYVDARRLLVEERPQVLVVASPSTTHEAYLRLALAAGAHVLCEKPLVWGGDDPAARAREIVGAFLAEGLHLGVNAQWPHTLDTYRRLFPEALRGPPATFRMRLSPRRPGADMVPDAVPHALSLLAAVLPAPDPEVASPSVRVLAPDQSRAVARFVYRAGTAAVRAEVELRTTPLAPRPAAYGFDGLVAERHVDPEGYRLSFEGGGRRMALPDPTPRLVRSFLSRISSSPPRADPNAWPGMAHLQAIHAAWPGRATPDRPAGSP